MSRIVVKNLPKNITEAKLRDQFSEAGIVTDIQLKYTKEGRFRQFAFVGFQNEVQGLAAVQQFNRTCIATSRITVEQCEALGAATKPKSWSKYSTDSTAFQKTNAGKSKDVNTIVERPTADRKAKKTTKVQEIFEDYKSDPKFLEFIDTHGKGLKSIWKNDLGLAEQHDDKIIPEDSEPSNRSVDEIERTTTVPEAETEAASEKEADQAISDAEYLKRIRDKSKTKPKTEKTVKPQVDLLTIKVRNIPFKTKRQDVIGFFKPTKPYSIRLPTKVHGICYVGFKTEIDFKKAMLKNRSFWKGKQILFTDFTEKNKESKGTATQVEGKRNSKWAKQEEALKHEEDISESGRIFFRNLPYSVTEEELRQIFEKFGPLTEINLPIDPVSRIIKGFGTVTFVLPENAVLAFNELDGTILHGRLLHLIPGKCKDDAETVDTSNFKQKKAAKLKQSAGSAHNWNTLFLGGNAVADLLAKRYGTTKEQILDSTGRGTSTAVRLALGETEIILKMKAFLEENEVCLDAFDQPTTSVKRSNTVIIAKNLPAGTTVKEIQPMFGKFGLLGRVVLPPSGVTAIIEFLAPTEARAAFKKLAYSRFKNLPLYLEWAPDNTFKASLSKDTAAPPPHTIEAHKTNAAPLTTGENAQKDQPPVAADIDDDAPPEPTTTLFLRNLNFTTREPTIRQHFQSLGPIHMIQVALKKNPEDPTQPISLGYGFIQFKRKSTCDHALNAMQFTTIDGNRVELKRSDRTLQSQQKTTTRKTVPFGKQTGTKLLVRNIPFQAKQVEIQEIFQAFGHLKSVRLPKKMSLGEETHRGFGFVDFHTESDAKKAFEALCQSTHLYGRRLVLEWAEAEAADVDELRKRTAQHFIGGSSAVKQSRKSVFDATSVAELKDDDNE